MGHVTVLGENIKEALNLAFKLKNILKVKGEVKDDEGWNNNG